MFSTLNANNTWSFSRNLGGVLSNKGENGYSVMHDGKSLLLGNVFNKDGSVSDGLSVSHKEESGWSYPEKITIKKFSTSNPNSTFFMSNDNKILLLSLERKNGYGGLDIYVSFLIDKNTYSEPLNLGPYINTVADDCSPFLANDNLTLYYSTSGLSGFGSNDIFMTRRLNQKWSEWTEPLNLGPKINSSDWDAYFTMPSSGEYAYYISYKNSSGEGDVFRIEMPRIIKPFPVINITGRISDSLTNAPVAAKITPFISQNNKSLAPEFSDNKGEFRLCLPASDKYNVSISAEGFEEKSIELDLSGIADGYEISKDIFLTKIDAAIKAPPLVAESIQKPDSKTIPQKKKIGKQPEETPDKETGKDLKKDEDENAAKDQKTKQTSTDLNQIFDYKPPKSDKNILASIFFDYAASELTPTACQLLDSIAEVIHSMPECVIEIAGNADPKGSFASNIRLSIERSKKVREYLTGKNCNPKRLLLKGYSNLFPGFPNSSERSSSLNRRVDIILLQKKRFESLLEK